MAEPIDPRYAYLFRDLNPQSIDTTQRYLDIMRQRGVSASLGPNVLATSPAPGASVPPTSNEAANALAELVVNRQQQAMDPLKAQAYLASQGIKPTLSLGSGSTTTRVEPGQLSPEAAAATAASLRKEGEEAAQVYGITKPPLPSWMGQSGEVGPVADPMKEMGPPAPAPPPPEGSFLWHQQRAVETYKKNIEKNEAMLAQSAKMKKEHANALERANSNLRNIEDRINSAEIDPQRFYRGPIGAVRAVLGAVAAAFGAYAQGISGGKVPNTAVEIINRAIDRDIDAQKANLSKLLQQRGFAADQRAFIMNRFDAAAQEQKAYTLRQSELEFAKQLQEANEPRIRIEGSKLINDFERRAVLAEEMGREKRSVTRVSGGHQVLNPAYAAAYKGLVAPEKPKEQQVPAEVSKRLNDSVETLRNVDDLVGTIDRVAPNRFAFMNMIEKNKAEFERQKLFVMQQYRKAISGAAFSEKESKEYMDLFNANTFVGWQAARNFLATTLRKQYQLRAVRAIREAETLGRVPTKEDWDAIMRPTPSGIRPDYAGKPAGGE